MTFYYFFVCPSNDLLPILHSRNWIANISAHPATPSEEEIRVLVSLQWSCHCTFLIPSGKHLPTWNSHNATLSNYWRAAYHSITWKDRLPTAPCHDKQMLSLSPICKRGQTSWNRHILPSTLWVYFSHLISFSPCTVWKLEVVFSLLIDWLDHLKSRLIFRVIMQLRLTSRLEGCK